MECHTSSCTDTGKVDMLALGHGRVLPRSSSVYAYSADLAAVAWEWPNFYGPGSEEMLGYILIAKPVRLTTLRSIPAGVAVSTRCLPNKPIDLGWMPASKEWF